MSLARKLERRLERLVEGASSALFRGRVSPLELANRLEREADLSTRSGPAGDVAPNVYSLTLHPDEMPTTVDPVVLEEELEHVIESTATERGWRLEGPVRVRIEVDAAATVGTTRLVTSSVPGQLRPWATLVGVDGAEHELRHNRVLVGRFDDADVRLDSWEASRTHATIWRQSGKEWIADLGSKNGTFVDAQRLDSPRVLGSTNLLTFGAETFTYRKL